MWARPAVSSQLDWEQLTSPGSRAHVVVGNMEFPAGCWTEGLSLFLSARQSTPSISCHGSLPTMVICFFKARKRESGRSGLQLGWCNYLRAIPLLHRCCILLVRSKSEARYPREGAQAGIWLPEGGDHKDHVRVFPPTVSQQVFYKEVRLIMQCLSESSHW